MSWACNPKEAVPLELMCGERPFWDAAHVASSGDHPLSAASSPKRAYANAKPVFFFPYSMHGIGARKGLLGAHDRCEHQNVIEILDVGVWGPHGQ